MDSTTNNPLNKNARFKERLGVIGASPHWIGSDGTPWAYEPYVREMRIWADLFSSVQVCGAPGPGAMKGNQAPYERANLIWHPVLYSEADGLKGALKRLVQLPGVVLNVWRTVRANDFILLRSPTHFGLIGSVLVRMMNKPSITKWAGENGAYTGERFPTRLERSVQNITDHRHPMLVYGPAKRPHHISFLPALMTGEELTQARRMAICRTWTPPWRILSVGRLTRVKGFDLAIRGLAELERCRPDLSWHYTLIGDGNARGELEKLAADSGVSGRITFTGALSFDRVQEYYAASHIAIMPGVKEGWPKVIAEAWAHGTVPLAASAGLVPWILRDNNSGKIFEPTPSALAASLLQLLESPESMRSLSDQLYSFAEQMSLDQFRSHLEQVLVQRCGLE
jgi:glycosyltransferase involved in cell wall biosynthesis